MNGQPSPYSDDSDGQLTEAPNCGPYCETCGDCLACYGEDHRNGCQHNFVKAGLSRGGYAGAEQE